VAERFDEISRPAVSRHLRVLRESGLVQAESVGRQRIYRTDMSALDAVTSWIASLRPDLERRLDAMETEVHRTRLQRERREQQIPDAPIPENTRSDNPQRHDQDRQRHDQEWTA
jgi:DNA-binding transcriptional ArsR family regulator